MNDKEIRIDNLTKTQVKMLDKMWSMPSTEDFEEWYNSLSEEEMEMADQLRSLLIMAVLDTMVETDHEPEDLSQARNYLKKFML